MHKVGAVSGEELEKTTLRMLGKDAAAESRGDVVRPKSPPCARAPASVRRSSPAFMNVAVNTVSQWERGERHPTGAALKLLNVVKQNGLDALL